MKKRRSWWSLVRLCQGWVFNIALRTAPISSLNRDAVQYGIKINVPCSNKNGVYRGHFVELGLGLCGPSLVDLLTQSVDILQEAGLLFFFLLA